jgi:hypothetical protein
MTQMVTRRINKWDRKILTHGPAAKEGAWRIRTNQEF